MRPLKILQLSSWRLLQDKSYLQVFQFSFKEIREVPNENERSESPKTLSTYMYVLY